MTTIPQEQILDAHKLTADGELDLFELVPVTGTATVYFKSDNDVTWLGNVYHGLPAQFSGEGASAQSGVAHPRLQIGQENVDLSLFKPLLFDKTLDGATITRITILLDDLVNNRNVATRRTYKVRRVEGYSRTSISLQLSPRTGAMGSSIPYRSYLPPAFPAVTL